jgi:ABC-type oligopeptide transport system substrate-binding subunit
VIQYATNATSAAVLNEVINLGEAQALQQMWEAAFPNYGGSSGITLKGVTRIQLIQNAGTAQLSWLGWLLDYPADQDWYDNLLTGKAEENQTGINVPQADQLVAQADVATNVTQAETLYQQAEQLYVNNAAWIVLDQPYDSYVVSQKVAGYSESSAGVAPPSVLTSCYITQ